MSNMGIVVIFLMFLGAGVQCNVIMLPDDVFHNLTKARIDIYIQQHERQTSATTKTLEHSLAEFQQTFRSRLDVINLLGGQVEEKLRQIDALLNPLEMFSDVHSHCVQLHRKHLPIYNTIKITMAACISKGTSGLPAIIAAPTATVANLKAYYTTTHAKALSDCKKLNPNADKKYADCTMKTVNATMDVTNKNMQTFLRQMESSQCASNSKIKEVFDCYSQILFESFSAIGMVKGLVNDCIAKYDFCPTCVGEMSQSAVSAITGRCPFQMSWHLADDDLKKTEIKNPFQGINDQASCLQINFIRNGGVFLQ